MTSPLKSFAIASIVALAPVVASAANVEFNEALLQTATSVTNDGLTLTASAADGGTVETYTLGGPSGLYFGGGGGFSIFPGPAAASGTYTLGFDQAVSSIEIKFGWLTNFVDGETLFDFQADGASIFAVLSGAVGTAQDGITGQVTTSVGNGKGTLTYDAGGSSFSAFSFKHTQDPSNIGFVINSVIVDVSAVPLPAGLPLLLGSVAGGGFVVLVVFLSCWRLLIMSSVSFFLR
jgi:hypothetical protein